MKNNNQPSSCSEYSALSRRGFLSRSGMIAASGLTSPMWLPKVALAQGTAGTPRDVMVHVFLRGAIDGLSVIVPYGDGDLYNARPNLAVAPPGQTDGAIDLDGFFGLNPNAQRLTTPYSNGHLAVVHAAGSTDPTRSHFDGMKAMEGGVPEQSLLNVSTGWLGRHLADVSPLGSGLLRGMAIEDTMPLHMIGSEGTLPVKDPANFQFPGRISTAAIRRQTVENMYVLADDPLDGASLSTFGTIDLLDSIDFQSYQSAGATPYPTSPFGQKLRSSAALIKAGIQIEAIGIDYGGWDHHNSQGPINGVMAFSLSDLSTSLEAFYLDLLATGHIDSVTTLVMSEFGRRVAENVSLGTDHGHGNMMLAMGGHIAGGQVFGTWPGLAPGQLDNGDVQVTTDYRDVVSEILTNRMANTNIDNIFPGHVPMPIGITI
ncbi:MAG: hypothetical protein ACI9HE_000281 [Planctomycetota bacterium]|jgi:uncharacterized protein (DUF1501 family)